MSEYYSEHLSADRLARCYAIAPARVQRYLEAEIEHVLKRIGLEDCVLELGCGYGRVLRRLAERAREVWGIDTSESSLELAQRFLPEVPTDHLALMDASCMTFSDGRFDVVVCVQNGLSAFGVDRVPVMREAIRVTRPGGVALFSSYAPAFWKHRLAWFQAQAEEGLIGAIDEEATGDGVIVCEDGFRAETIDRAEFLELAEACGFDAVIEEVDGSSLVCEVGEV